ncbi:MAG: asparagine synthase-related protein [Pseudomonadota bacterium]
MSAFVGFHLPDTHDHQSAQWCKSATDLLSKTLPNHKIENWQDRFFQGAYCKNAAYKSFESPNLCIYMVGRIYGHMRELDYFKALYDNKGIQKALENIHGDFAMIIADKVQNKIYLVRDKVGIFSLYYAYDKDQKFIGFSTYPMILGVVPFIGFDVNDRFVDLFAASHYRVIDNDRQASPFKNIKQVPASHFIEFDLNNGNICEQCYWQIKEKDLSHLSENQLIEQYRSLLYQAVDERLKKTDGEFAFTLSGGMDSSSVLSMAHHVTGNAQHAFSSVYLFAQIWR